MGSFKGLRAGGLVLALVDLALGFYILAVYTEIQYSKYHCNWAHGIRSCDYFTQFSNHSQRTIFGIIIGVYSILFSIGLMIAFIKSRPLFAWIWLGKAISIIVINSYYVADWLIKRGRGYHSYWDPDEYREESWFLLQGGIEIVVQLVISFFFCFINGIFTYKARKQTRSDEFDISKVNGETQI